MGRPAVGGVEPRPLAARPGLAVRIPALGALEPGRRASVMVTVAQPAPITSRAGVASSLWHVRVTGAAGAPRARTAGTPRFTG